MLVAADAYEHFNRGVEALFRGEATAALEAIDAGLVALPGEENLLFLRIGSLLATGSVDEAEEEFRALVARQAGWEVIARSFAAKGLLALPPGAGT
ncbi:MAG TPA: hypothetical protein VKV36_05190 [Acidimicrobiales bacterium]|nr:hypothetical protein [Acidimicrobiales bacterium]